MENENKIKEEIADNMDNNIMEKLEEIKRKEKEIEINEEWEMEDNDYDDLLDDIYPVYQMGNMTFYPSQVLKNCDEVAYNMGKGEVEDRIKEEKREELEGELENLKNELEELREG